LIRLRFRRLLINVLRYLVEAWHEVQGLRRQIAKGRAEKDSDDELIADILKSNIYGVDINPSSVEIAELALWLHTARGDKPLSSLDENIREGNSLIGSEFYKGQINLALYRRRAEGARECIRLGERISRRVCSRWFRCRGRQSTICQAPELSNGPC
jgi:hypothetical protein